MRQALHPYSENQPAGVTKAPLPCSSHSHNEKVRTLELASPKSFNSPRSNAEREKEVLVKAQIKKLAEMRKLQIEFFDQRIAELKEVESRVDEARRKAREQESLLQRKEALIRELLARFELEKEELHSIRELLRVENESTLMQSRDLRRVISKYQKLLGPTLD